MLAMCAVSAFGLPLFGDCAMSAASAGESDGKTIQVPAADEEFRAVWIAYYDFDDSRGSDRESFRKYAARMFDNAADMGMNAVVVHVRPFSDAMYKSKYYPWSKYASGVQGTSPGYDPLEIMVEEAHARNLEIHAWLNPYRITSSGTDIEKLAKSNPARKWLSNSKTSDDRNVLAYGGALYYNPSKSAVRKLIINGVKEIVSNYDVDGIHFDDYFYPSLKMSEYETVFDAPEYEEYAAKRRESGKKPMSIVDWRKKNVNTLVKGVYSAVKDINPDVVFGISPGGFIDYFDDVNRWYVDYRTWLSKPGYVDYICPQIYWSFNSLNTYPFMETLVKWSDAVRLDSVKLYIGIPAYKMNSKNSLGSSVPVDTEFYNQRLLAEMIRYSREIDKTAGWVFFDYSDMVEEKNAEAVEWIKKEWGN